MFLQSRVDCFTLLAFGVRSATSESDAHPESRVQGPCNSPRPPITLSRSIYIRGGRERDGAAFLSALPSNKRKRNKDSEGGKAAALFVPFVDYSRRIGHVGNKMSSVTSPGLSHPPAEATGTFLPSAAPRHIRATTPRSLWGNAVRTYAFVDPQPVSWTDQGGGERYTRWGKTILCWDGGVLKKRTPNFR